MMEHNEENNLISKLYEYECEIYGVYIYVDIGIDDERCQNYFITDIEKFDDESCYAYTIAVIKKDDNNGVLIRFRSIYEATNDVIAHECSHAAFEILDRIDFKLDYDNQEPYSYLLQWIFMKVEEARDDYIKVNDI